MLLLILSTFAAVNGTGAASCPTGYATCGLGNRFCCSDNGDVSAVAPAISELCPPPQLFGEEPGSMVCETECCESTGTCAFNATKVALRVTGGSGAAHGGYEDGTAQYPHKGRCWFRSVSSCVYGTARNASDPTSCGMEFTPRILRLNDEDHSNSIVTALNDVVSQLISIELILTGDYPWWR